MRPASPTPASLPATDATSSTPATANTAAPPTSHCVLSPVDRKKTGITVISTMLRNRSIGSCPNHLASSTAPDRKAPTMKCSPDQSRSEEHTSELQSLMRTSYAVFCLKKKKKTPHKTTHK